MTNDDVFILPDLWRIKLFISNALNALVSSEQVRFKQTSETLCTDGRVPDESRERVRNCGAGDWKGTAAVSVETVARNNRVHKAFDLHWAA